MKGSVFIATVFIPWIIYCEEKRSNGNEDTCVFVDHAENQVTYKDVACSNSSICRTKRFHITYINVVPYVYVWNGSYWGIDEILLKCCGPCVRYSFTVLKNITQLTLDVMKKSDFVFPILSKTTTQKLYGKDTPPHSDFIFWALTFFALF